MILLSFMLQMARFWLVFIEKNITFSDFSFLKDEFYKIICCVVWQKSLLTQAPVPGEHSGIGKEKHMCPLSFTVCPKLRPHSKEIIGTRLRLELPNL